MSAWLNMGSLFLGFAAWGTPMIAINRRRKGRKMEFFSVYSFTFCAIAVVLQLFEIRHRVAIQDFSAIMDTIGAVTAVSVILVVVTVILNAVSLAFCAEKN